MIWLLGAIAAAEEPEGVDAPSASEAGEEITVWAEQVARAREAVIGEIERLGYTRNVRERDDRLVFIHEQGWKGKVVLYDDGRIATKRTGPSGREMEPIAGTRVRPYFLCLIGPTACVRAGAFLVSDRRWMQIEDEVIRETAAETSALGDRIADQALAGTLAEIPDRLYALWSEGRPLEGADPLPSYEARRAAALQYWDSRTETEWGLQVREAVAAFIRGEIEASEHPYTDAEREDFEAHRRSSQPFPW